MKIAPLPALLLWAMLAYVLSLVNVEWGHIVPLPPFGSIARNALCIVYLGGLLLALMQTARHAARMVSGGNCRPPAGSRPLPFFSAASYRRRFIPAHARHGNRRRLQINQPVGHVSARRRQ